MSKEKDQYREAKGIMDLTQAERSVFFNGVPCKAGSLTHPIKEGHCPACGQSEKKLHQKMSSEQKKKTYQKG